MWLLGLIPETWRPDNSGLICCIVKNELGGIGINVTECWSGAAMSRPDIVQRCREIPCRVVMTEMRDGSAVLWSKDKTWIDDVRRRNPALNVPGDVNSIEMITAPKETPCDTL